MVGRIQGWIRYALSAFSLWMLLYGAVVAVLPLQLCVLVLDKASGFEDWSDGPPSYRGRPEYTIITGGSLQGIPCNSPQVEDRGSTMVCVLLGENGVGN